MTEKTQTAQDPSRRDPKDWPELETARASLTPEQAFALEKVRLRAENASKLLITRSKVLLAATILSLMSVVINGVSVVPELLRSQAGEVNLLLALSMIIQLAAAGYFLRAKDPLVAVQVIRFVLILNGVILFVGFSFVGMSALTAIILLTLFAAYKHVEQIAHSD